MTKRVHNFSAGPSALPLPVLAQVQRELTDFRGTGMSIMEMSHRGKVYEAVHNETIADLKTLLGVGNDYSVLFMGGGARTQFALLPTNLLPKGGFAEYVLTGTWAEGAYEEAKKLGDARALWSSKDERYTHVPQPEVLRPTPGAAYLHYCSNNTIYGTQYHHIPETHGVPLICDMSSDILSRPVDVSKFAMIYAGAQKNMGPSGVTFLLVRNDLLERVPKNLPDMWSYAKVAKENSLLNTPPTFAIYMVGLVAKWLLSLGGLAAMGRRNQEKAELIYKAIDNSGGFYTPHARPSSRSWMNVTFRLPNEELTAQFVTASQKAELEGLKGHRSVGGIRASIYNAVDLEAVRALVAFMDDFRAKHG